MYLAAVNYHRGAVLQTIDMDYDRRVLRHCSGSVILLLLTSIKNFLRVDPDIFMELLHRVGPRIEKHDTFFGRALPPELKLAVTLRYLAIGDSYKSLAYSFRVAFNTISIFIPEICQAIIDEYSSEVLVCPNTPDGWKEVALGFQCNRWNFPHVIGAIDGKPYENQQTVVPSTTTTKDSFPLFYWLSLMLTIISSTAT